MAEWFQKVETAAPGQVLFFSAERPKSTPGDAAVSMEAKSFNL